MLHTRVQLSSRHRHTSIQVGHTPTFTYAISLFSLFIKHIGAHTKTIQLKSGPCFFIVSLLSGTDLDLGHQVGAINYQVEQKTRSTQNLQRRILISGGKSAQLSYLSRSKDTLKENDTGKSESHPEKQYLSKSQKVFGFILKFQK